MSYFIDYELLENNASLLAGGRLRCEAEGEVDEVFDAEAFGAEVEDRPFGSAQGPVGIIAQGSVGINRLQGVAQGLAPLSESGLHDSLEQLLVAAQLSP